MLKENQELKAKLLEYAADAQKAQLLATEQKHLADMSPGRSRYATDGVLAEMLSYGRNPFTRKLVLDKGLSQGVQSGMPVIDADGVVGQVTAVGTFTSEATLLTEKDQAVPVMLTRNGLRAIAVGSGKDGSIDVPFIGIGHTAVVYPQVFEQASYFFAARSIGRGLDHHHRFDSWAQTTLVGAQVVCQGAQIDL